MPGNHLIPTPTFNGLIAAVREVIAGFLMAPELLDAALTLQRLQNRKCLSGTNHQGLTEFN
jgi:hypothetical protein